MVDQHFVFLDIIVFQSGFSELGHPTIFGQTYHVALLVAHERAAKVFV